MYILIYAYDKVSSPNVVYIEDDIGNISPERLETPKQLIEGETPIGYFVLGYGKTRKEAYENMIKNDSYGAVRWFYDAPDFECQMLDTYDSLTVLNETTGYYFINIDDDFYEWLSNRPYTNIEMADLNYCYNIFLNKAVEWEEENITEEEAS